MSSAKKQTNEDFDELMRGSKEAAEAERRRRLASVAIDYSAIVETAAVKSVQPMERVTKQLSGLLDRAMDQTMQFDDAWKDDKETKKEEEEEKEEDHMLLFSSVLKQSSVVASSLVPARGVADDSQLVVERKEEPKTVKVLRSEWAKLDQNDDDDDGDVDLLPDVQLDLVEREVCESRIDDEEEQGPVSLFSERVIAGRQMYKRQREPAPVAEKQVDRAALELLCVDGKDLMAKSRDNLCLFAVSDVEAMLPGNAIVVPHPGEQPPSPDPVKKAAAKPKVHKRWAFNQIRDEAIDQMVTARQRKRNPGVVRKLRRTLPEVRKKKECVFFLFIIL